MSSQASLEEPLPDILTRLVGEIHHVADLIERIEPELLKLTGPHAAHSPEHMKVLQGIDLAVQKARGLAEFIDTMTGRVPDGWMVDVSTALNLVKLTDLRKALANGLHSAPQSPAKAAGDPDFF